MDTATDDIAMADRHDDCDGDGHDDDDGVPRNSLLAAVVVVDDGVDDLVDYYWTATGVRNDAVAAVGCSLWNYSASSGGACEMWAQR